MEGTAARLLPALPRAGRRDDRGLQLDEFGFGELAGAEDGDAGERTADHGNLVTGVEAGAGLTILVDLVGQRGAVGDAEAEVKEEVRDAGEEADAGDPLVLGFFEQTAEELAAGALALGFRLDDDRADLGKVRAVDVQGAAAEEDTGLGLSDLEVADVFADFGVVAAEEGAVAERELMSSKRLTASWSLAWRTCAPPTRGRDEEVEVESLISAVGMAAGKRVVKAVSQWVV